MRTQVETAPLVSVIIPTYNSSGFIAQAVQSVLEQTHRRYEVIVVDDGSTDETKDVLSKFGNCIKYLYQENRGPAAARNMGIKVASGEYICFLDADDVWTRGKLELQIAFMEHHPTIGLVFADHEEFNAEGVILASFLGQKVVRDDLMLQSPIRDAFMRLVIENFISTPTVMVRKECFETVGLFDESLRSVEDRDLWLRISAHFEIACLPEIVCRRRVHKSNISENSELSLRGRVKVLEKNRRIFSNLVPAAIWHRQLADAYLQLGYVVLEKNQRMEALRAGVLSLMHAVRRGVMNGLPSSYPWGWAIGLILAGVMGWGLARSLWRAGNTLIGRGRLQAEQ